MTEHAATVETDVLIVGAGPVGMTLALALADGGWPRVLLLDRRARGSHADDPRALALAHGTRQLLERLRAWNAAAGTPIGDIHVSQRGGFGRAVITREEQGVAALGYVMRYRDLAATLAARLDAGCLLERSEVVWQRVDNEAITVRVRCGGHQRDIRARLVVHAEGTPGADPGIRVSDYRQHAVLAEVETATPHGGRAWERFTADGPLALLPLGDALGKQHSLVFTVPPAQADALMAMGDAEFLAALQRQFGSRLAFTAASPRARYPLALRWRQRLCAAREVWIGNAAQTLHPVSGQGFNLGIRDAWELAETILMCGSSDAGNPAVLAAYARRRQPDRIGGVAFTDGIVRAFSNDFAPLRVARGLGLLALDLCPPARQFVADRMIWGARAWL